MELTYEESEKMIESRLSEHPELALVVRDASFKTSLASILSFEHVDPAQSDLVEVEIKLVLAQYAPVGELGKNISMSTGLAIDVSERITTMIESLILRPVYDELLAFDLLWDEEIEKNAGIPAANLESKERLLLRPDAVAGTNANSGIVTGNTPPVEQKDTAAKPLTRDELMSALAGKRTMASDIEAVRKAREAAKRE